MLLSQVGPSYRYAWALTGVKHDAASPGVGQATGMHGLLCGSANKGTLSHSDT